MSLGQVQAWDVKDELLLSGSVVGLIRFAFSRVARPYSHWPGQIPETGR